MRGGRLDINNAAGKLQVMLGTGERGGGLGIYNTEGKTQAVLDVGENGGKIRISNKTGEEVVQILADEYGNGYVGAFNRKGRGRTLKPGN